ncbi:MAG: hypothetical protein KIS94_12820 [Chitinophagales bacterium]|nr:hypothetical protein [Chitinophagales bacterium]
MKHSVLLLFAALSVALCGCKKYETKITDKGFDNGPTDSLKMNEIQIIASHNSYHLKTDETVFNWLKSLDSLGVLPSSLDPDEIDYTHETYENQFNLYNVRGLEIDIYNDPTGGQYYYQMGRFLAGGSADSHNPDLNLPGFKVIHLVDFDFNSHHTTFKQTLQTIYNWSVAHPNHLPLFINVETNEETVAAALPAANLTQSIPYDNSAADLIDEEIKSVFGNDLKKVITPDKIRGNFTTLREAVLAGNWLTLAQARNKVVFIMQGAAESYYKAGHPSLQGRAMFVYANPNSDEAAFVILNSAKGSKTTIQQRVQEGFIVRTRSDAGTTQARNGDYSSMDAAFESGAQIISTDYYRPDARAGTTGWTDYKVQFPNGELARINPVSAAGKLDLGKIKE